jgi:thymidylate synthase (FAD)
MNTARYSILDKEFYIPEAAQLCTAIGAEPSGARREMLSPAESARVLEILKGDAEQTYNHYEELMNCDASGITSLIARKTGVARELARMNLTLNYYTQWYWKIDLHNLMHFLMLRADPHAQYEIRVYADAMIEVSEKMGAVCV